MTKYAQIIAALKKEIRELPPDTPIPGERKLSARYGVNFKTVNKAVSRLTHDNLLHRIRGRGTFTKAQSVNWDGALAVIVPNLSNQVFQDYIQVIHNQLLNRRDGTRDFIPFNMISAPSFEQTFIEKLASVRNPRLIKFPTALPLERSVTARLKNRGIKTVMMNDFWSAGPTPSIRMDEQRGVRDALTHLLDLGHRNIAFLDVRDTETRRNSLREFKGMLKKHGIPYGSRSFLTYTHDLEEIVALLKRAEKPTAVYTPYELFARQAIRILEEHGYSVPRDISIISGEDSPWGQSIGLTRVKHPKEAMAAKALDILFSNEKGSRFVFKPELVVGKTTDRPRNTQ